MSIVVVLQGEAEHFVLAVTARAAHGGFPRAALRLGHSNAPMTANGARSSKARNSHPQPFLGRGTGEVDML